MDVFTAVPKARISRSTRHRGAEPSEVMPIEPNADRAAALAAEWNLHSALIQHTQGGRLDHGKDRENDRRQLPAAHRVQPVDAVRVVHEVHVRSEEHTSE